MKPPVRGAGVQVRNGTRTDSMRIVTDVVVLAMTLTTGRTTKRSGAKIGSESTRGSLCRYMFSGVRHMGLRSSSCQWATATCHKNVTNLWTPYRYGCVVPPANSALRLLMSGCFAVSVWHGYRLRQVYVSRVVVSTKQTTRIGNKGGHHATDVHEH